MTTSKPQPSNSCDRCKAEVPKTQEIQGWDLCFECWLYMKDRDTPREWPWVPAPTYPTQMPWRIGDQPMFIETDVATRLAPLRRFVGDNASHMHLMGTHGCR